MEDGQDSQPQGGLEALGLKQDGDQNLANLTMLMALASQQNSGVDLHQLIGGANPPERNKEKDRIAGRLNGFNPKDNSVWREITTRFGHNIKQPELLSIAQVLATNANVKLDRDAKRRKTVLVKWFEENWTAIQPFIDCVVLEDAHVN